jgi:hypothetical protein
MNAEVPWVSEPAIIVTCIFPLIVAGLSVTESSIVNAGQGSALSELSNALDQLRVPPPTRPSKPESKLISRLASTSSSESESMGDLARGPSLDLGNKPMALIERIQISSGSDSDNSTGNIPTTIVEGNISLFHS